MRNGADQFHGNQPGDPVMLAVVVIKLATSEQPPIRLPIGKDSVAAYRRSVERSGKDVEAWPEVSVGTDYTA
jgi:hypothetical protein